MAYGALVHALESFVGFDPARFFANSISHVIDSHLPIERFHAAGRALACSRLSEGQFESQIKWHVESDLNPFTRCMVMARSRQGALMIHANRSSTNVEKIL